MKLEHRWMLCISVWMLTIALVLVSCFSRKGMEEASEVEPELVLRYAENQPEDYPTTQAAYAFAELVKERTEGRVQVRIYADAQLGTESSVIEQMLYGGIDFARVSLSPLTEYQPGLKILQLPYLYEDSEHMWRVLDGEIGDEFLNSLTAVGLVGLSWFDAGARSFYSQAKLETLEDLSGLRIRVQEASSLMSDMIIALGAEPVTLDYSQVYQALLKGEIDAAENNWSSYVAMDHYEVAPYVLLDQHTRIPEVQIASQAAIEALAELDESFPEIVQECAQESAQIERELWMEAENEAEQQMRDAGVTVTELSDKELEKFRDAMAPLYEAFEGQSELLTRIRAS